MNAPATSGDTTVSGAAALPPVTRVERTALVTGASQGLGEAIAASLHAAGCRVMLAARSEDRVAEAASRLDPTGERAAAARVDVRERDSIAAAIDETEERFGPLEVLVNNAARSAMGPIWEIDESDWDDVIATNLRSVLFAIQIAGARMRERGFGRIINHASIAGQQGGLVMGAHYAASKAGIIVLTKIAAQELAPSGVTVNALAPAAIDGPLMRTLRDERVEAVAEQVPVKRLGRQEEVGAMAAYLASDLAGYITGATIDLNGGLLMR